MVRDGLLAGLVASQPDIMEWTWWGRGMVDIDPTDGLLRSEARIGSMSAVQVGGVDVESSIHARGGAQVGVSTGLVF